MSTRHATAHEAWARPRTGHRWTLRRHLQLLVLPALLVFWATSGCGPDPDEAGIDRETFIMVQVELRLATIEAEGQELGAARRDSILGAHGVTHEAMAAFLAVHGDDEAYMADLWQEVDERVLEARGMEPADVDSERAGPEPEGGTSDG